jgi:cytochrome c-type biogenesis protein CcmH/NrfG
MPAKGRPSSIASTDEDFVKTLQARVRSHPGDVDALTALGVWLLQRDQADKALDCFHRVTRKDPDYPGIWRLKAQAFEALGDAKSADACRKRGSDKPA